MSNLTPMHVATPPCRLSFASLFEKTLKFKDLPDVDENKNYSATLLIPPDVDLKPFAAALKAAMDDGKITNPKFQVIHKCDGKKTRDGKDYAGYEDGWHYLRASNNRMPEVVDQMMNPVFKLPAGASAEDRAQAVKDAEARVFSGCWCRFLLRAFQWRGEGVSFSLEAVQLVREDERLGGGAVPAKSVFQPVATEEMGSDDPLGKLLG